MASLWLAAAIAMAARRLALGLDARLQRLLDDGWRAALALRVGRAPPGLADGLAAALGVAAVLPAARPGQGLAAVTLAAALAVAAWIDWRQRIIPDVVSGPLAVAGLLMSVSSAGLADRPAAVAGGLLGAALGVVVRRRAGGLGWGDIKLLGAIGCWLGPAAVCLVLILSSALLAIPLARRCGDRQALPMAPMLALATLAVAEMMITLNTNCIYIVIKFFCNIIKS